VPTAPGAFVDLPSRGLRLHYRDWGGHGSPLVLLHGLSSNSRIWDWTAPILARHFHVIALDQRSHGLSDQTPDGYGFADVTADLASFLEAVGIEQPVVVGHSWGASVALTYATAGPGNARAIVLVDGGVIDISGLGSWEDAEPRMRPPAIDGTPVESFVGFMRRWPQLQGLWSDDLRDMVLANFAVRDGRIYRPLTISNHMKIARAIYHLNPSEVLPHVDCPILVISCRQEPGNDEGRAWQAARQEAIDKVAQLVPAAHVVVMEDTIHDVPIQRPLELAEVILTFLAQGQP